MGDNVEIGWFVKWVTDGHELYGQITEILMDVQRLSVVVVTPPRWCGPSYPYRTRGAPQSVSFEDVVRQASTLEDLAVAYNKEHPVRARTSMGQTLRDAICNTALIEELTRSGLMVGLFPLKKYLILNNSGNCCLPYACKAGHSGCNFSRQIAFQTNWPSTLCLSPERPFWIVPAQYTCLTHSRTVTLTAHELILFEDTHPNMAIRRVGNRWMTCSMDSTLLQLYCGDYNWRGINRTLTSLIQSAFFSRLETMLRVMPPPSAKIFTVLSCVLALAYRLLPTPNFYKNYVLEYLWVQKICPSLEYWLIDTVLGDGHVWRCDGSIRTALKTGIMERKLGKINTTSTRWDKVECHWMSVCGAVGLPLLMPALIPGHGEKRREYALAFQRLLQVRMDFATKTARCSD